jgi:hypothetical protein
MHGIADRLEPAAFQALARRIVEGWERAVAPSGGSVAFLDVSAVEGTTALLAWLGDGPGTAFPDLAREVLAGTRALLDRALPANGLRGRVVLAGVRGPALHETEAGRVVLVLGGTVNEAIRLAAEAARSEPPEQDALRLPGIVPGA